MAASSGGAGVAGPAGSSPRGPAGVPESDSGPVGLPGPLLSPRGGGGVLRADPKVPWRVGAGGGALVLVGDVRGWAELGLPTRVPPSGGPLQEWPLTCAGGQALPPVKRMALVVFL